MPVAELQERVSQREFTYWQAFYARKAQREEMEAMKAKRRRR